MTSDPGLRRLYLELNAKWFGGELPEDNVSLWWEPLGKTQAETQQVDAPEPGERPELVIRFNPALYGFRNHTKFTMLHEMVHVEQWPNWGWRAHGKRFQERMLQLAQAGAFKGKW